MGCVNNTTSFLEKCISPIDLEHPAQSENQNQNNRNNNNEFADFWKSIKSHKNIWTIDHIKTSVKKQPTLYVCIPEGGKTMYQFQKHEIEEIVE